MRPLRSTSSTSSSTHAQPAGRSRLRIRRRRLGAVLAAAALTVAGSAALGAAAQASPNTKYYTATISPALVGAAQSQQQLSLTLTNCASGLGACTKTSQQTIGSANIAVDPAFGNVSASVSTPGFFIVTPVTGNLVELRTSTGAINPGQSVPVTITADTPAGAGTYTFTTAVKQSNDFSGTGNLFTISGAQPTVQVIAGGLPDHLAFETQPSTVQVNTPMCPAPTVQVVDKNGAAVTGGSAQLTVAPDTAFGNPGLGGTTTETTVNGLATFGAADCSSGLTAATLGTGYQLEASGTWTLGSTSIPLATQSDSGRFDVVQSLTMCQPNATCTGSANGKHTGVVVNGGPATTTDQLEIGVGLDSLANTTCTPANQPADLEVTRVLLDHRDKTATITFDKFLVNQAANNGTPLFTVCFAAPWGNWLTADGSAPTFNTVTNEYEGILPDCGTVGLAPQNPCVSSRSKHAGAETVVVLIPYQSGRVDPKLW